MAAPPGQFEFTYEDMAVGYFEEPTPPISAGRYRYEPYRGPGHYEMQTARRDGNSPRCSYVRDGRRYTFVVVGCPDYGVLELAEFSSADVA